MSGAIDDSTSNKSVNITLIMLCLLHMTADLYRSGVQLIDIFNVSQINLTTDSNTN